MCRHQSWCLWQTEPIGQALLRLGCIILLSGGENVYRAHKVKPSLGRNVEQSHEGGSKFVRVLRSDVGMGGL